MDHHVQVRPSQRFHLQQEDGSETSPRSRLQPTVSSLAFGESTTWIISLHQVPLKLGFRLQLMILHNSAYFGCILVCTQNIHRSDAKTEVKLLTSLSSEQLLWSSAVS